MPTRTDLFPGGGGRLPVSFHAGTGQPLPGPRGPAESLRGRWAQLPAGPGRRRGGRAGGPRSQLGPVCVLQALKRSTSLPPWSTCGTSGPAWSRQRCCPDPGAPRAVTWGGGGGRTLSLPRPGPFLGRSRPCDGGVRGAPPAPVRENVLGSTQPPAFPAPTPTALLCGHLDGGRRDVPGVSQGPCTSPPHSSWAHSLDGLSWHRLG